MSYENGDRQRSEEKRYKFALVILASALFVVIFALINVVGDISLKQEKNEPVVTTTQPPPPVTQPPVVRVDCMISDTKQGTLIVINDDNSYTMPDEGALVVLSDNAYMRRAQNGMRLLPETVEKLNEMFSVYLSDTENETEKYTPIIKDAYRDFATQETKYNSATDKSTASRAGHSDLHSGYSFRLRLIDKDGSEYLLDSIKLFDDWLNTNMAKYGFIDRYPENGSTDFSGTSIVGYGFFRYVGLPHSLYISKEGISLEDYIELLRSEYSINENDEFQLDDLLAIDAEDGTYYVMHVTAKGEKAEFSIPQESKIHSFSGDNMGGFVVVLVRDSSSDDAAQIGDAGVTPEVDVQN